MGCPLCLITTISAGSIGSFFGIHAPKTTKAKLMSCLITTQLVLITALALKHIFKISLCNPGKSIFFNILQIGTFTFLIGVIYGIGVNALLNRYNEKNLDQANSKTCCCKQALG